MYLYTEEKLKKKTLNFFNRSLSCKYVLTNAILRYTNIPKRKILVH